MYYACEYIRIYYIMRLIQIECSTIPNNIISEVLPSPKEGSL